MNYRVKFGNKKRYRVEIFGVVQGVGYRPYTYNQAKLFNITGWVSNHGSALVMDIEGEKKDIKGFLLQTIKAPPDLALIEKVKVIPQKFIGFENFEIQTSSAGGKEVKFIPWDVGTCRECLNEVEDPNNHRYHYPFTNCTTCGPRYSIIKQLPYDRENTTMDSFTMCKTCEKEYTDPKNRRFHAQTNCCPSCGPTIKLWLKSGEYRSNDDVLQGAIELLQQGKIVAIKGLGGFHFACDPRNTETVAELRRRKNRPHKPFALMVKDIETAKNLCFISEKEEQLLTSNRRPILLLRKKTSKIISDQVAPNMKRLGIMLSYTPLHTLLFGEGISVLVMTSGNISNALIQYENQQSIENLEEIADAFLIHDRDIHIPVEDSVVKVIDDKEIVIRRGRGYTPYVLPMKVKYPILALGAEQKSTFCLSQNGYGYISPYLGDLKNLDVYYIYEKTIAHFMEILGGKPDIYAHDLHHSLLSSQYAQRQEGKKIPVQHHHAHMVSCMVEHHLFSPVIGVIFDGTGLGTDGNIWGGEFFVGSRETFKRVGHLKYVTIQGGDQSIIEPWRAAFSYLHAINYEDRGILREIDDNTKNMVKEALNKKLNCYQSSSMGRIFDCAASLLNICHRITYDAQAAIELENIVDSSVKEGYIFEMEEQRGVYQILYEGVIRKMIKDIQNGVPASVISAKFHHGIGNAVVELVCRIRERYGISNVVLSGGVFENNYLLCYTLKKLKERDLYVYYNQQIPTNDSGISVGQLAIADAIEGKC